MSLPLYAMTQNKLTPVVPHIAGWIFFFSLVLGFLYNSHSNQSVWDIIISWSFLGFSLTYLFVFYFNTYVLIPIFYLEKKFLFYFLFIAILFAAVYFIRPFDNLMNDFRQHDRFQDQPPVEMFDMPGPDRGPGPGPDGPPPGNPPSERKGPGHTDIISIILFVAAWSLSTAMCIIRQWRLTEKRAIQAEADKVNAELSFLKAQINPHFLFNTLNNIYSLAVTKNENTAASIMKLSNIMRYVTDEIREDFVSLDSEIECMKDYIDLQKLRLGKNMNIDLAITGKISDKEIAPLVLMTFVENVFKYGISSHNASDIIIKLSADRDTIHFFCRNRLFDTKRNAERTGIGISNTRKRLQHLYPEKHDLNIIADEGFFTVQLTLQA